MLKLLKTASPEDLFMQRYELLMGWALALTGRNHAQAEDLVHDAFIHFTLRRGDLAAIENPDAYLHRVLRNMHLSQARRAALIQESRFSVANFDSAEMSLRTIDPSDNLSVQDELRRICQYACTRKETSKTGSVLILRFFHSYYPSEIARLLRGTRKTIDKWLRLSRREARQYLSDPGSLKFVSGNPAERISPRGYARTTPELLGELRQMIFESRTGDCLSLDQLKELYRAKTSGTVDCTTLAHVVSCPRCLDEANRLLGLTPLSERHPTERLGKDVPPDDSGPGGPTAGGSAASSKKRYERRLKEVVEHQPQELRIAVNGFVLGAQQISSEFSKLVFSVNVDEPIGFIEVFSEQDLRLLFFDVDQPIDGTIEQNARAEFDLGRTLDLTLSFRGPWPTLQVSYHDPTFEAEEDTSVVQEETPTSTPTPRRPFKHVAAWLRRFISDWTFWLRPGLVTTLFALILIAVAVFLYRRGPAPVVSAADLLSRSTLAEEAIAARTDQVLHRTLALEEKSAEGQLLARRRIEIWQSAEKGVTARRLYDEKGQLAAGDWRRKDGVQTFYHHGTRPQLQLVPEKRGGSAAITFDNVWELSPSAKEFSSQIGPPEQARVEENLTSYTISYAADPTNSLGLVRATLVLSRADLHAIEETLVVRQGSETHEFHLTETSFERKSPSAVAPAVFEPEMELLGATDQVRTFKPAESVDATAGPQPLAPLPVIATPELEVEVLRLLSQARADLGEQIDVTRTPNGLLEVRGIVETAPRKEEILKALQPVRTNRAVKIDISTEAEVERRNEQSRASSSQVNVQQAEPAANKLPIDAELRRYFSARGLPPDQVDLEISRFANRSLDLSRQALRHAWAIKRLTERFSQDELRQLEPQARTQWIGLIRNHAQAFQQEVSALRQHLGSIFPALQQNENQELEIKSDEDLVRASARLVDLASTSNRGIQSAFTLSVGGAPTAEIKNAQFWQSMKSAERLAARIQSAK